jgi:DNA-binding LacI/PurR family transcriptional regulator
MKTQNSPTIRDVARQAGVSTATVSYVLNDGPRQVNEETKARVLAAMKELDYQPNAAARNLANRRTNTIGLILAGLSGSSFASSDFLDYVRGISHATEASGFNLLLFGDHSRAMEAGFYRQLTRSRSVDGVILLGSSIPDELIVELDEEDFPAVLLARSVPGSDVRAVHQDYEEGTYQATRHLCLSGYRQIALLGQALRFSYGLERLAGYKRALLECGHGYDPRLVSIPAEPRDDPTEAEVAALLARAPRTDAVLTDRGLPALNAIRAAGRRVPEEIGLLSLDEGENSGFFDPPLSTLRAPKFELGKAAAEMVTSVIRGESPGVKKLVMPMELVLRESSPRRE